MKFQTIIFLVILFNVVTAFLQRRAKRAKEKLKADAGVQPALRPASISGKSKEKAISLGKDLLGQLAKELGLRLPEAETEPEILLTPQPQIGLAPQIPNFKAEIHEFQSALQPVPHPPQITKEASRNRTPFGLDTVKMREAVILREILDKPVSMRTGRFKR